MIDMDDTYFSRIRMILGYLIKKRETCVCCTRFLTDRE